jgi:hypothetical protein
MARTEIPRFVEKQSELSCGNRHSGARRNPVWTPDRVRGDGVIGSLRSQSFAAVTDCLRKEMSIQLRGASFPACRVLNLVDGRLEETVSKFLGERKTPHDILSPGNKLPVYYPATLRDDKDLSPVGAIDSSPVGLQPRVKMVARFRAPGRF